ncbi:hypothetical protein GCM10009597_47290 [Peribacillus frigoritolerans]
MSKCFLEEFQTLVPKKTVLDFLEYNERPHIETHPSSFEPRRTLQEFFVVNY